MKFLKRLYFNFLIKVVHKKKVKVFNYSDGSKIVQLPWSVEDPDADNKFPKVDPLTGKTTYPEGWGKD